MHKRGFTLIEILTVVVIISLVVTMAVPAYKRSKASGQYERAKGQLAQLGMAVKTLQQDLTDLSASCQFPVVSGSSAGVVYMEFQHEWQTDGLTLGPNAEENPDIRQVCCKPLPAETHKCYGQRLFARGYLNEMVFDNEEANTLEGYKFYVCNPKATPMSSPSGWRNAYGCKKRGETGDNFVSAQPVVSMQLQTAKTNPSESDSDMEEYKRAERLPFFRAVFMSDGTIERQTFEQAKESETSSSSGGGPSGPLG